MNKIIKLDVKDIIIDAKKASDMLNTACNNRSHKMQVKGLCQLDDALFVTLEEESNNKTEYRYVLATFPSLSEDDLTSTISDRYNAGFSTLGSARIGDDLWGLFAFDQAFEKK